MSKEPTHIFMKPQQALLTEEPELVTFRFSHKRCTHHLMHISGYECTVSK